MYKLDNSEWAFTTDLVTPEFFGWQPKQILTAAIFNQFGASGTVKDLSFIAYDYSVPISQGPKAPILESPLHHHHLSKSFVCCSENIVKQRQKSSSNT